MQALEPQSLLVEGMLLNSHLRWGFSQRQEQGLKKAVDEGKNLLKKKN